MIALSRNHFLVLGLTYALAIIYASLMLGPDGMHYVRLEPTEALRRFLAIRYVAHDADQRPDWIANLLLLVPLGYLTRAALQGAGGRSNATVDTGLALIVCVLFVLAVKFAQLYVPPRTVTLNYVTAQVIGATLGIALVPVFRVAIRPRLVAMRDRGDGLQILLGIYTAWLILYFLLPFDFTLSVTELRDRLAELPAMLLAVPGRGHAAAFRALLVVADIVSTIPVGMFLATSDRRQSLKVQLGRGVALMITVEGLTWFVISATPFAVALIFRTAGIALGLLFMEWIKGKDLRKRHYTFSRFMPAAILVYALFATAAEGLFSGGWIPVREALDTLDMRQLIPLWPDYIVSKAEASRSLVEHAVLFAPIGVMVWVRRGFWSSGARVSAVLAFGLSLAAEIGRGLKPGLRPDFTDPIIAAVAAGIAFKAMPLLWRLFEQEATMWSPVDQYVASLPPGSAVKSGAAVPPAYRA